MAALYAVVAILLMANGVTAAGDYYRMIEKDTRNCSAPACGGFFIQKVNSNAPKFYVAAIDWTKAGPGVKETVAGFFRQRIFKLSVCFGKLTPFPHSNLKQLIVETAYLGLPLQSDVGDFKFYEYGKSNAYGALRELNTPNAMLRPIAPLQPIKPTPLVDLPWQMDQITKKGAIVMGGFSLARIFPSIFIVKGVFIKLPVQGPCPEFRIGCASNNPYMVYRRTADLCFKLQCLTRPPVCPGGPLPTCPPNYRLAGWRAPPTGCNVYSCDPSFVPVASKLQ